MTPDDLATILRFLYGDRNGLGLAQAAHDIGTKEERLREMLAGKRTIPAPFENYWVFRTALRGKLWGWEDQYAELLPRLSERASRAIDALRKDIMNYAAA